MFPSIIPKTVVSYQSYNTTVSYKKSNWSLLSNNTAYILHNCSFIDRKMFVQVIHAHTKGAGAALVKALSACPHRAGLTQSKGSESQRASEGLRAPVVENS